MDEKEKTIRPVYLWVAGIVLACLAWFTKGALGAVNDNTKYRHKSEVEIEHIKEKVGENGGKLDRILEKIK